MPGPKPTRFPWLVEAIKNQNSGACLLWPFAKHGCGYGSVRFEGRYVHVHCLAFYLTHGRWPTPQARHTCDVRACFNPRHIIEGTHAQNMADKIARSRQAKLKGEDNHSAKLTDKDIKKIRALGTVSQYKLAARFGVCHQTIWEIIHRKTWKHLS